MAESFIILPSDAANTGKQIRAQSFTIAGSNVYTQHLILQDRTNDFQAAITTDTPSGSAGGLVVRNIPSGTQAVSGTVGLSGVLSTVTTTYSGTQTVGLSGSTATLTVVQTGGSSVSLGSSTGKTVTMKTGNLVTTTNTANQAIATYTVTGGKTFYVEYFDCNCRLTTFATTATNFGTWSFQIDGTTQYTGLMMAAGARVPDATVLAEPIPVAAGLVARIVCTPSSSTSYTWQANLGGYEK